MRLIDGHSQRFVGDVRAIFKEYADWLGFDLCFQGFEEELAKLPGDYAPPSGSLILAVDDEGTGEPPEGVVIAGCVALRKLDPGICEMKRLYVRDAYRGTGLGRRLAAAIIDAGREIGYEKMRLDTLPSMTAAVALYESFGFVDTGPYRFNPIEGARYMELDLASERRRD